MFRASHTLRRTNIAFERCVARFFPEAARPYKEIEERIAAIWRDVYSAPSSVTPIDFTQWEKLIQNKALVAEIKKEYQSKTFPVSAPEVYQTEAQAQAAIDAAVKESEFYVKLAADLKVELDAVDAEIAVQPFLTTVQIVRAIPGLYDEYERQLEDLQPYTPDHVIKALDTLDAVAVSESLAAGKIPDFPLEAYEALDASSPVRQFVDQDVEAFRAEAAKYGVKTPTVAELCEQARATKQ